jgi:hypothetical protein
MNASINLPLYCQHLSMARDALSAIRRDAMDRTGAEYMPYWLDVTIDAVYRAGIDLGRTGLCLMLCGFELDAANDSAG